jgi:hypothetical protein
MSNDPNRAPPGPGGVDDLQFDRAEAPPPPAGIGEPVPVDYRGPVAPPGVTACAACGEPITDAYFEANGKVVCPRCRDAVLAAQATHPGPIAFIKGLLLGVLAGAVGAAAWYGVRVLAHSEWSIIAIGIAILVGGAIRAASGGRGGLPYQLLAVALTYVAICANYIPDIYRAMANSPQGRDVPAPFLVLSAFIFSLRIPFLLGVENAMGWVIIAIGLWVAWKSNRPRRLTFNGPYRLATATAGMPPPFPRA